MKKMLRPKAIHICFKIMLVRFTFYWILGDIKFFLLQNRLFFRLTPNLNFKFSFNFTRCNTSPILKHMLETVYPCSKFPHIIFPPKKLQKIALDSLASQCSLCSFLIPLAAVQPAPAKRSRER